MTCIMLLKLLIYIYPLCKVRIPILHLHPELWTCLHKYPLPAIDSRIATVKIIIPTILGQPYMHIPWFKRVYKECQSIGSDTAETMVLQHYPPQQEDLVLDSSRHSSDTLFACIEYIAKEFASNFQVLGYADTEQCLESHIKFDCKYCNQT